MSQTTTKLKHQAAIIRTRAELARRYPKTFKPAEHRTMASMLQTARRRHWSLDGFDFSYAQLNTLPLSGLHFAKADFTYAVLTHCDASACSFTGATLRNAECAHANFEGSDFTDADLNGATFYNADLSHSEFRRAALHNVDFEDAQLQDAYFYGANDLEALQGALIGKHYIKRAIAIGPLGRRDGETVVLLLDDKSLHIRTGCFTGDLPAFRKSINATHYNPDAPSALNRHGHDYIELAHFLENWARRYS